MYCRLAATAFAGALVLVPPVSAGLDGVRLAGVGDPLLFTNALGADVALGRRDDDAGTRFASTGEQVGEGATAIAARADVTRFGSGPGTGFFPSDSPRELVLSFDDGPDLKFTPLVLDELDRRGLKAIFFVTGHRVVGDRAEDLARRELLGRIVAHGHMVANHTMTHANLCRSPDVAATEIDQNAEVITQATGVRPLLFRAPYGARCRTLEAELASRELVSVGWNLDPQDWRNPTSADILTYLQGRLSRLSGRGILLLHDTHPASVFALGPLLDWIARENGTASRDGRPPIVLRDYGVFLPARPIPATGLSTVMTAVFDEVVAGLVPRFALAPATARH